jgi:hypothetical protein
MKSADSPLGTVASVNDLQACVWRGFWFDRHVTPATDDVTSLTAMDGTTHRGDAPALRRLSGVPVSLGRGGIGSLLKHSSAWRFGLVGLHPTG